MLPIVLRWVYRPWSANYTHIVTVRKKYLYITLAIHFCLATSAAEGNAIATLQAIQPAHGAACPGEEVILSCKIPPTIDATMIPRRQSLRWELQNGSTATMHPGQTLNTILGDFTVSGLFLNKTAISNTTLDKALLSHNNVIIGCHSAAEVLNTSSAETVMVAGTWNNRLSKQHLNLYILLSVFKVQSILHMG